MALPPAAAVVVHQNTMARTVEVIELAASERIPEDPADQKRKYQADRNQQKYDIDGGYSNTGRVELAGFPAAGDALRNSLSAFAMTSAELAAIPTPASRGVTKPHAASGIASAL